MAEPVDLSVSRLLESQREVLLTAWMNDVLPDWRKKYPKLVEEDVLRSQSRQLMEELRKLFAEHPADTWEPAPDSKLAALLREATAQRAKQGFAPTDTALYLMSLKRILLRHLLGG
ncbi:MAG TPA: hypothetical protein GX399_11730, partial [Xanthomonadaceae bacterium]|nr:hypothetical protein [Xanthomonadaceae bacterium]